MTTTAALIAVTALIWAAGASLANHAHSRALHRSQVAAQLRRVGATVSR